MKRKGEERGRRGMGDEEWEEEGEGEEEGE